MRRAALLLALALVLSAAALRQAQGEGQAVDGRECRTPEAALAEFARSWPDVRAMALMGGAEAAAFIARFNAAPPATAYAADAALLVERPGSPTVWLVLFERGCATRAGRLDRDLAVELLGRST